MGRSGAWVHGTSLWSGFTWAGLVFGSAVLGLGPASSWGAIDLWVLGYEPDARDYCVEPIFLVLRELVHYWDGMVTWLLVPTWMVWRGRPVCFWGEPGTWVHGIRPVMRGLAAVL